MDKIRIVIDGKECFGHAKQTILAVAQANDIFIPTLCFDERVAIYGSCGICVVEVANNPKLVKACATEIAPEMHVTTNSDRIAESRKTNMELLMTNHTGDCKAPCTLNCPAGTDCQGYVGLIANGQHQEALMLIKDKIPLPGALGRVCPHPCETKCRRGLIEEPIGIMDLKRVAADFDAADPWLPECEPDTGKKVAIIGAGPMGISTAYFLRQKGHAVTVYEQMPYGGGMLRYGIPQYRLPKEEVLDKEIQTVARLGVDIKFNTKVGRDISFDEIRNNSDVVLVAIGAWISTGTGCKGEDADGVIGGIDFLQEVIGKNAPDVKGKNVAIVGGGNTAMDCCRTALRLGAAKVYNIYRRTKKEMPADEIEIIEGEEEGVIFKNLTNPIEILTDEKGHAKEILLQIMELGEPDASGRRAPVAVEGKTEILPVDMVLLAIGQAVEESSIDAAVSRTKKKGIAYDPDTFMTSMEGVFAGGDCGNDKISIAIEAIADANKAAVVMDAYLRGEKIKYEISYVDVDESINEYTFEDREKMFKAAMPHLNANERKGNFKEIVHGFDEATAMEEAKRCLECGCGSFFECKLIEYTNMFGAAGNARLGGEKNVNLIRNPEFQEMECEDDHPYVIRDIKKCINCELCVRMCHEVVGVTALGLVNRGFNAVVKPALEGKLEDAGCISCGNCISVCPTGALQSKVTQRKPVPVKKDKVTTTCPYCGVGCQIDLQIKGNKVVGIMPAFGASNEGILCVKGKFAYDFIDHPDRLTTPLIRKGNDLVPATWDEALNLIADTMKKMKAESGADAFAGLASARVTNEENYLFQKLFRAGIGTNNVDHCARLCHSSTVTGLATTLGAAAMTNSIMEVMDADAILITGSNTAESHPVIAARIGQAVRKGAQLIVIDPRRVPLAKDAAVFLQVKPGTNVAALNGMMNVILEEGLADDAYIAARTEGIDELKAFVKEYTPEKVAAICGIDAEDIRKAARIYATAAKAPIYYAMGVTQFTTGTDAVMSISNLALICGKLGKKGCGVNPLRGQNNVQGACDMGCLPGDLPGYQKVADADAVKKFSDFWGVNLSDKPGKTLLEILESILKDEIRFLYIMGENPVLSDPDITHLEETLEHCEFLVVQDIFLTETAKHADVVLPASCYAEKDGTFVNTERRVQRVRKAVNAPGEAMADLEILAALLKKLGLSADYAGAADVFAEISKCTPTYGGISYGRLEDLGSLQWPCPDESHPGTPILHVDNFSRGDKALLKPAAFKESAEITDAEYPLILTTGRVLAQYHTRTMTGKSEGINKLAGKSFVEIHPADAAKFDICDGDMVTVSSRRGQVKVAAKVTEDIKKGVIFMPFHYADGPANMLTNSAMDPEAKIPELKACAANICK
jgi:formate dehydrogenase major subunit